MNISAVIRHLTALAICIASSVALGSQPGLIMAYSEKAPPVSWLENDKPRGIFVDVVEEIVSNRLGIPVEHRVLPWARAQQMVKDGDADGLVTAVNDDRKAQMNIGNIPVQTHRNRIVVRSDHPELHDLERIESVNGLMPYKIGVQLGNGWARENLKGFEVIEVPSIELLLKMLVAERIDLVIQGDAVTLYYIKELGYVDKLDVLPNSLDSLAFRFMVDKNSRYAELPNRFDIELQRIIDDGTLEKIFDRYR